MKPEDTSPQSHPPPLPSLADGKFHPLDPNSIPVERIGMAISSLVFIGVAALGLMFAAFMPALAFSTKLWLLGGWVLLFPALAVYSWIWPPIAYRHMAYCLKEDCFIFRRGVFWKMETLVPKSRIQHTDIGQGPIQRAHEVSSLIIHTAGTRFALVTVNGLSQKAAPRLRNHLLDRSDNDTL